MFVFLTPRARRDARRIIDYYVEEAGSAAWFTEAFQQAVSHLERFPLSGTPRASELQPATRVWRFKQYQCIYRVHTDTVQILTVIHTSRDAQRALRAID